MEILMLQQLIITNFKLLLINTSLVFIISYTENFYLLVLSCLTLVSLAILFLFLSFQHVSKKAFNIRGNLIKVILTCQALIISYVSQKSDAKFLDILSFFIVGQIYKENNNISDEDYTETFYKNTTCMILLSLIGVTKIYFNDTSTKFSEFMGWFILIGIHFIEPIALYHQMKTRKQTQYNFYQEREDQLLAPNNIQNNSFKKRVSQTVPQENIINEIIIVSKINADELAVPVVGKQSLARLKDGSSILVMEGQRADKKQFFKALLNQMPDGIAIIELDYRLEFFSQSLIQILDVDNKSEGLQALLELQNCQEQFEEQEIFNQLFNKLNDKFSTNKRDQSGTQHSIMSSYQSQSMTVSDELELIIHDLTILVGLRKSERQYEKQKISFLSESKMLCQMEQYLEEEKELLPQKQTLLQIIFKPYIQFEKPFILIIVKDVTMFNEISVLKEVNQNKSKMLAQVAHEFRTPLNGIIILTENQIEDCDQQFKKDYLGPVLSSANWLLSLVNDILDLAQLNAGKFTLVHQLFDIKKHLIDVAAMMTVQTDSKGIELTLVLDPLIPVQITSDPNRIKQVVLNLLSNAIKFTPKGGSITILANQICERFTEITIQDSGVGIPKEDQSKLCQAFVKIDGTSNMNTQGVGLGLMICNILSLKLSQTKTNTLKDSTYGLQVNSDGKNSGSKFSFVVLDQSNKNGTVKRTSRFIDTVLQVARTTSQNINYKEIFTRNSKEHKTLISSVHFSPYNNTDTNTLQAKANKYVELTTVKFKDLNHADKNKLVCSFKMENFLGSHDQQRVQFDTVRVLSMAESSPNLSSVLGDHLQEQSLPPLDHDCYQILIVDDVEINIIALRQTLTKKGYTCDAAYNANDALDQLRSQKACQDCYRIILMDIEMPKINGMVATKMIRQEFPLKNYHIIGCSGYSGQEEKKACIDAGMNDYIEKPIRSQELMNKIRLTEKTIDKQQ